MNVTPHATQKEESRKKSEEFARLAGLWRHTACTSQSTHANESTLIGGGVSCF